MEYLGKNNELLAQAGPGHYYILDAQITRFDVYYENEQLYIDVYFLLPYNRFKTDKRLKLHFIGVTEYEFHWDNLFNFYTVERYKFFRSEKGYYLSTDPYDEAETVLDEDGDIIFSSEVEGYFV